MPAFADFPTSIWDGSSATRSATLDREPLNVIERAPDSADWQQGVAEIIAIETALTTTTLIAGAGNTATLANAATSGFAFLPKVNGTPTGVPAAVPAGYLASVYDYSAHKIWVYDAGWKATAALA
jgi:hypothetical protein